MKKSFYLLLLITLYSSISFAQSLKSISILGDSYSTFEGYLQPDTNSIWYYVSPRQQTDVTSVKQTWWHKFIKENNCRLCVNNSFPVQRFVIPVIIRLIIRIVLLLPVWISWDVRISSLFSVQRMIVGPAHRLGITSMKGGPRKIYIHSVRLWHICLTT